MMPVASQKRRPIMLILIEGTGKNQLEPGHARMGDAAVLSHWSLLRSTLPKPTGVLEHCLEGDINCSFSIFRGISF
jgi:hypothetical protein